MEVLGGMVFAQKTESTANDDNEMKLGSVVLVTSPKEGVGQSQGVPQMGCWELGRTFVH